MHADQDDASSVARARRRCWLQQLLAPAHAGARRLPRRAAPRARGGRVGRAACRTARRSAGARVELTDAGADDPVLGALPRTFEALQWHHYTYGLPAGAVELARSAACTQAFRLGDACWGVQFHPEVTADAARGLDRRRLRPAAGSRTRCARRPAEDRTWNELGRSLCAAFLKRPSGCSRARPSPSGSHDPSHDRDHAREADDGPDERKRERHATPAHRPIDRAIPALADRIVERDEVAVPALEPEPCSGLRPGPAPHAECRRTQPVVVRDLDVARHQCDDGALTGEAVPRLRPAAGDGWVGRSDPRRPRQFRRR